MPDQWLLVSFITSELEEGDPDLVLAFAITPPNDPRGNENLILIRTPKYEAFLHPEERGVSVSYDGAEERAERVILREFHLEGREARVRTDYEEYLLDLRRVEPEELDLIPEALKRMNFDRSFRTSGV